MAAIAISDGGFGAVVSVTSCWFDEQRGARIAGPFAQHGIAAMIRAAGEGCAMQQRPAQAGSTAAIRRKTDAAANARRMVRLDVTEQRLRLSQGRVGSLAHTNL